MRQKLVKERHGVIEALLRNCPGFRPPPDYRPEKKVKKIYIPVKEFPGYNFFGLIIGPRGNTQKRLQRETNTRIAIRGKGSVKDGQRRDFKYDYAEEEDMHVLITGEREEDIEKAAEMVYQLPTKVQERADEQYKRDVAKFTGQDVREMDKEYQNFLSELDGSKQFEEQTRLPTATGAAEGGG